MVFPGCALGGGLVRKNLVVVYFDLRMSGVYSTKPQCFCRCSGTDGRMEGVLKGLSFWPMKFTQGLCDVLSEGYFNNLLFINPLLDALQQYFGG